MKSTMWGDQDVQQHQAAPGRTPGEPPAEASAEAKHTFTAVCESFDTMGLSDTVLRGVYAYGFERPSEVQKKAIAPVIAGNDCIVQAQSGTGKTATFSIAALQRVNLSLRQVQVMIVAPTRELSLQICGVVQRLGEYLEGLQVHACVGGTSVRNDITVLRRGVHVVVGTPGRINDMINRRILPLQEVQLFILDEADEMLSRSRSTRPSASCPRRCRWPSTRRPCRPRCWR